MVTDPVDVDGQLLEMNGGSVLFDMPSPTTIFTDVFFLTGSSTLAAASGKTVVFDLGTFFAIAPDTTAIFGSPTATGTIVVDTDAFSTFANLDGHIVVAGGTLKEGDNFGLAALLFFSGSTTVNAGATIDFNNQPTFINNLKGAGHVAMGSDPTGELALFVDEGTTAEFSGEISGSGGVVILTFGFDSATMIFSGANTYLGGTTICDCSVLQLGNGGTSGSIVGNVVNGGTLAFNRSDTYVFNGIIQDDPFDPGDVVQLGTGTTVLTAANTYSGTTTVRAGKLVVNGSILNSATTIFSGAALGGTGTLGSTTVNAGGVHAPGNSIGTQRIVGSYVLGAGAVLEIEANAAGASDRVEVTGTVDLTGAVLRVLAQGGAYAPNTQYVIIDNDGVDAVTGSFGQVTSSLAFLTPTVTTSGGSGNDVVLTLTRNSNSFAGIALTPNQTSVAGALAQLPTDHPLFLALLNQDAAGARTAFDALSGEVHATLGGLMIEDSRFVREAILARLAQAFYASGGSAAAISSGAPVTVASVETGRMSLGMGDGDRVGGPRSSGLAFWTHGYGAWGELDSTRNAAGAERSLGGFVSGMDAALGGSWRIGLATGYEQSNASVDARLSSIEAERYHLAAYAGGALGPIALRSGAAWTWHDIDTSRLIAFPGFRQQAEASYDGDTGQVFGELALPFVSGRAALEPFAGLAYVRVKTDSFTETGGIAALRSAAGTEESTTYATLGVRAATTFEAGGLAITPRVSAAWRHAFEVAPPGISVAFVSAAGGAFGITGVPIDEDSALIEAGLDFSIGSAKAGVSYSGQLAGDAEDHGVKGTLLWQF